MNERKNATKQIKMKQSEQEEIYDTILSYLQQRRNPSDVDDIIRGTNKITNGLSATFTRLEHLNLIEKIEPPERKEPPLNEVFGGARLVSYPFELPKTRYKISETGKIHLEHGGFKRKRFRLSRKSFKENLWGWLGAIAAIAAIVALFIQNSEVRKVKEENSIIKQENTILMKEKIENVSQSDIGNQDTLPDLKNDTLRQ
jgi:hypothetical protein